MGARAQVWPRGQGRGCSGEDLRTGPRKVAGACLRGRGAGKAHGSREEDKGQGPVYGMAFQDRES